MAEIRFGGRCEKHIAAKPCAQCAAERSKMDDKQTINIGEQWIPSNGSVGHSFLHHVCGECARNGEGDSQCQIISASFRCEAVEWRELPDGEVKCIAFIQKGEPIPSPRCQSTADMFHAAHGIK